MAAIERYPVVIKFDGLAAGKGVVIAADEAEARARAAGLRRGPALRRRAGRRRGAARRRGALAAGAVRRRARGADGAGAGLQAHLRRRPRARTPAAWAPTRRSRHRRRRRRDRRAPSTSRSSTSCPPRHAVPRRPLRRADAHRRGPARARVQRALRRPRDAGGAAAAARRPARRCSCDATRPGGLDGTTLEWDERWRGHGRARLRAATRPPRRRATSSAASTRVRPASRSPTPARRAATTARSSPPAAACSTSPRWATTPTAARDAAYAAARSITFEGRQLRTRHRAAGRGARGMSEIEPQTSATTPSRARDRVRRARRRRAAGRDHHGLEVRHAGDGEGRRVLDERAPLRDPRHVGPPRPRHRRRLLQNARMRGLRVIIAGAGLSAALPGVAAAHTDLPVIGVPLSSRLSARAASTRSSRSSRCRPASRSPPSASTTRATPATWRCGSSARRVIFYGFFYIFRLYSEALIQVVSGGFVMVPASEEGSGYASDSGALHCLTSASRVAGWS